MLKRSNIVAAEEDLQVFYRVLDSQSLTALWTQGGGGDPSPRARLCLSCGTGGICAPKPAGFPQGLGAMAKHWGQSAW